MQSKLFLQLKSLLDSLLLYLQARTQLFKIEAKEAVGYLLKKIILLLLFFGCLMVVYFALLSMAIVWVIESFQVSWYLTMIFFGGFHLLLALMVFILFLLTWRSARRLFSESKKEFTKDREWVNSAIKKN